MWRLPTGRTIVNPQAGRTFQIGDIRHNETSLLRWADDKLLEAGIYKIKRIGYDSRLFTCSGYTEEIVGGTLIQRPILAQTALPFAKACADKVVALGIQVNTYICDKYDLGAQATYQSLFSLASTPQAVKDDLLAVFSWTQAVLAAYFTAKDAIIAAETFEALAAVTIDYMALDAINPDVHLQDILGRLIA